MVGTHFRLRRLDGIGSLRLRFKVGAEFGFGWLGRHGNLGRLVRANLRLATVRLQRLGVLVLDCFLSRFGLSCG